MKYIILVIIVVLMMGCSLNFNGSEIEQYMYDNDLMTQDAVLYWVSRSIEYRRDVGEQWQSPLETFNLRAGDCEDLSILACYMLDVIGIESFVAIGRNIITGASHSWIFIDTTYKHKYHINKYPLYILLSLDNALFITNLI